MKKLFTVIIAIAISLMSREALARGQFFSYAQVGGRSVVTSSSQSSSKVQLTFPGALVSVYVTGTVNLATLYSDSAGTAKGNPFTAGTDGSLNFWTDTAAFDITFSGKGITTLCGTAYPGYPCISAFTWSGMTWNSTNGVTLPFINIKDAPYSASPANTAAQNVTAIQATITACPVGGKIIIPDGTFQLDAPLALKSNITIEGTGTLSWVGTATTGVFTDTGADITGVVLRGFKIRNDNTAGDTGTSGIYSTVGWTHNTFNGLEIIGFLNGIDIGANSFTITNATNATPIQITTSAAHGFSTGNAVGIIRVLGNTAANGYWTITWVDATNFTLDTSVGNGAYTSEGNATAAAKLKMAPITGTVDETPTMVDGGNIITHCYIHGETIMSAPATGGQAIRVDGSFSEISFNKITNSDGGIILVNGNQGFGTRIIGNYIANLWANNAIYLSSAVDAVVEGNTIYNVFSDGIAINGGSNISIIGNQLRVVPNGAIRLQGASHVSIVGNICYKAQNLVRFAGGVTIDVVIDGNSFDISYGNGVALGITAAGGTTKNVTVINNVFSNVTNSAGFDNAVIDVVDNANLDNIIIKNNQFVTGTAGVTNFIYSNKQSGGTVIIKDNISDKPVALAAGAVAQGMWVTPVVVPNNSSFFKTSNEAGGVHWTMFNANILDLRYLRDGKKIYYRFAVTGTTVSGGVAAYLSIPIPEGLTARCKNYDGNASAADGPIGVYSNNGGANTVFLTPQVGDGAAIITLTIDFGASNWAAATALNGEITFEVN